MARRNFRDPQYIRWRKAVYGRDRHLCQMPGCTRTCKLLNAHHIKCWESHPELRFVPSNGITLCRTCHARIRGIEREQEATFQGIVASKGSGDVMLQLMAKRHAQAQAQAQKDPP